MALMMADNGWHRYTYLTTSNSHCSLYKDTLRPTARIHPIWKLRLAPKSQVVAETMHNIFHRSPRYEKLRSDLFLARTMDSTCRGLGITMDGRQRSCASGIRNVHLPSNHERHAILHHRFIYQEPETGWT
jgi:hypothetical protein